jgi:hypothetical protein
VHLEEGLDEGSVIWLRRLGRGSLVLLAVALPFELVDPIARVGPLQLSSVEVFLYASVGLWGLGRIAMLAGARATTTAAATGGASARAAAPWWRRVPPTHLAVAAWALALVLSAALTPVARVPAIKFALRSLGGVALYLAAADLLRAPRAVLRVMIALAAGGALAALLMGLESSTPRVAAVLRPFHAQTFGALGLVRASGPFQYPNIAAMYLEGVLPVLLAAGVVTGAAAARAGARRAITAASAIVAMAIIYALVLAASRAGLIAALVVLIGIGVAARRDPQLRRLAMLFVGGVVALTLLTQANNPMLALRLRFWEARPWHRSDIQLSRDRAAALPARMDPGARATVGLVIRNDGAIVWTHQGRNPVFLSYHWQDETTGAVRIRDGLRTALPRDVPSGDSVVLSAQVRAPAQPGRYLLRWDPVQEGVTWFSERGDRGLVQKVIVTAPPGAQPPALAAGGRPSAQPAALPASATLDTLDGVSRRDLWRAGLAAWRTRPVLGIGPDNFRRVYGTYLGHPNADERLHANNLYVETLTNLGAAGLLALAALMLALARAVIRAARVAQTRVLALGAGGALAAYAVHGTLDYFFEFTPTYGLVWLLAGMTVALDRPSPRGLQQEAAR